MQATTAYKCPVCGGEGEVDHNSFQCNTCEKLWPLSYFESVDKPLGKEDIYGKSPPGPLLQIGKKVYGMLEGLADGAHTYSAMLGMVVMLMLGALSVKGVPVYLTAGESEPTELLLSPTMGWAMIGVGLLGLLGSFMRFVKLTIKMVKERREARKDKGGGAWLIETLRKLIKNL